MLQQIVIADMTNLQWRYVWLPLLHTALRLTRVSGLVTGLISAPFIINNFVAAEIAQAVLPNWRWGYAMVSLCLPLSRSGSESG